MSELSKQNVYLYNGTSNLVETLETSPDKSEETFLIFTHVFYSDFLKLVDNPEIPKHSIVEYNKIEHTLLVRSMLSDTHEAAAAAFKIIIVQKMLSMAVLDDLKVLGSAPVKLGNLITRQPDGSWGPITKQDISVVLEVGFSQSTRDLEIVAEDYLCNSPVEGVVTVDIDKAEPRITVEYLTFYQPSLSLRPRLSSTPNRQKTVVTLAAGNTIIVSGTLTIPFITFLGRNPNPPEEDIIIQSNDLEMLAKRVWKQQGFM